MDFQFFFWISEYFLLVMEDSAAMAPWIWDRRGEMRMTVELTNVLWAGSSLIDSLIKSIIPLLNILMKDDSDLWFVNNDSHTISTGQTIHQDSVKKILSPAHSFENRILPAAQETKHPISFFLVWRIPNLINGQSKCCASDKSQGCTATERFSAQLIRAHLSGPQQCGCVRGECIVPMYRGVYRVVHEYVQGRVYDCPLPCNTSSWLWYNPVVTPNCALKRSVATHPGPKKQCV